MTFKFLVCVLCGVAYDVGANKCNTEWCSQLIKTDVNKLHPKPKRKKVKKSYSREPLEKHITRWLGIVARSKKKKLECDLELDDVKFLIESKCIYCGANDKIEVDRMDSSIGYTRLNVAPACHRCNTIKSNVVTYDEMMTIVDILGWRHK